MWQTTDATLIGKIQAGTVTAADLGNATQLGLTDGDLANAGCPITGKHCTNVYAVSIAGVTPAVYINWFQAAAAARNAGKRLPTNAEWQAAALGTPDPGTDNDTTSCNVSTGKTATTGSRSNCVSDVGAFDMVGNVWEWVADWVPLTTTCADPLFAGTSEFNCLGGPGPGAGALLRGGAAGNGANAGVFAVAGTRAPTYEESDIGFRAAR